MGQWRAVLNAPNRPRRTQWFSPLVALLTALTATVASIIPAGAANPGTGNASINVIKTVGSVAIKPNLALQFDVNASSAIPGDTLTYTATVTNSGSTMTISGASRNVGGIRNVVHLEVTPRAASQGQPFGYKQDFTDPFHTQSAAALNAVVTITPPASGAVRFDSSTTPGLASIAPGASVAVQTSYVIPAVAAKGVSESDSAY